MVLFKKSNSRFGFQVLLEHEVKKINLHDQLPCTSEERMCGAGRPGVCALGRPGGFRRNLYMESVDSPAVSLFWFFCLCSGSKPSLHYPFFFLNLNRHESASGLVFICCEENDNQSYRLKVKFV